MPLVFSLMLANRCAEFLGDSAMIEGLRKRFETLTGPAASVRARSHERGAFEAFVNASIVLRAARRLLRPQCRPFKEGVERGAHRLSPLGQVVFNLRRHLRVD